MKCALLVVLLLCVASAAIAEPTFTLPTAGERKAAEIASWVTALTPVVLDVKASFDCADRLHCFTMQGLRLGAAYSIAYTVKTLAHRARPCAPDACGSDDPYASFFSAHTMLPFTARGGARLTLVIPFGVSTGGWRVAAGKHWITDTLAGAGVGLATSFIR